MPVLAGQYLPLTLYFASVFLSYLMPSHFIGIFSFGPCILFYFFRCLTPPWQQTRVIRPLVSLLSWPGRGSNLIRLTQSSLMFNPVAPPRNCCSSGQISGFAATSCQQCALGSFAGSPGMSACELCLAGTYGQLGDTEKRRALYARVCQCVGMLRHNDTSSCLQCGAGSYSQAGSTPHELRLHFCKFIGQCLFMWHSLLVIGIQHASLQPPALSF